MTFKYLLPFIIAAKLCGAQGEVTNTCDTSRSVNESCIECFGRREKNDFIETRLIPSMEFTCNGTIVGWTVSGRIQGGTQPPKLQVWRKSLTNGDEYRKHGQEIPVHRESLACEEIDTTSCNQTLQCRLKGEYQVEVEAGMDVVGIELPPSENRSFEIFFKPGSQNHFVWHQEFTANSTVKVGLEDLVVTEDLLLSLNVSTVNECTPITDACENNYTNNSTPSECSCLGEQVFPEDAQCCVVVAEDTCASGTHTCQQLCIDTYRTIDGGYKCDCRSGYMLNSDNQTCSDIDECANNSGDCEHKCINYNGSFACDCRNGYRLRGDGRSCEDIDECLESRDSCEHACNNTEGSFQCSCHDGYTLDSDGANCTDIDECSLGTHNCEQLCVNTDGGFNCLCEPGYQLELDGINCTDIDECANKSGGCQQICSNSDGSFSCSCQYGYLLDQDRESCNDIDECEGAARNCHQNCNNTEGSFQCSCHDGYTLDSDEANCTDIDECSLGTHNCEQLCVNTDGGFNCECEFGYQLNHDGPRPYCLDVDECATDQGGCQHTCFNTNGSFGCSCRKGYLLNEDGLSCAEDAKRGSITGPAVGATLAVVLVVVVVLFGVILMYVYIHLRRSKVFKITSPKSGKRQLKHEISLPYLVENKGYSDADGSSRGPRILVLNAPIPVDEDRTNLEIYNSLFDEEGTSLSNHDNDTAPT